MKLWFQYASNLHITRPGCKLTNYKIWASMPPLRKISPHHQSAATNQERVQELRPVFRCYSVFLVAMSKQCLGHLIVWVLNYQCLGRFLYKQFLRLCTFFYTFKTSFHNYHLNYCTISIPYIFNDMSLRIYSINFLI